jgi:Ras-related protein Rab-5C
VGEDWAKEMGLMFWETSAKSGFNVQEIFVGLAKKLPKSEDMTSEARFSRSRVNINPSAEGGDKPRCCKT